MPATTVLLQADDKMPAPKVESRDSAPTNKSDPGIANSYLMSEKAINTQSDADVLPAINVITSIEGSPQVNSEDGINTHSDVGTKSAINVQSSIEENSEDIQQADDNIPATKPNSQSSPEEWLFYQVAPGNITYFENCSNFLPVITDHAGRSDMSSSDPTLATYNSVKDSDNFQQFKFLFDSLLSYQSFNIYDNFDK